MAILLCQLLLLFSETLLPAERPLRHSGDTSYPACHLQAGSRHQEWIGRGWASPLYKHRLLVNFGGLEQKHVLASIISLAVSFHTAPASHSGTQLVWAHVATIQEECCFYVNQSWIVIKSRSYSMTSRTSETMRPPVLGFLKILYGSGYSLS